MPLATTLAKLAAHSKPPENRLLPNTGGKRFAAGSVMFEQSRTEPYEQHYKNEYEIFGINIEPNVVHAAFDGDRVRERFCRPYGLAFHPAQSDYYYRREHEGQPFYCFATAPIFREAVFDEFGLQSKDVRTVFKISSPEIVHLTHQLEAFIADPLCRSELEAELIALNIVAQVARSIAGHDATELRGTGRTPADGVARAIEYLMDNLEQSITLTEVAKAAGLSRYHFARGFKEMTGESPMAFLQARRVKRAKRLLGDRKRSLSDIAQDCGFSSQSHFTTAFRQQVGKTPGTYRDELLR